MRRACCSACAVQERCSHQGAETIPHSTFLSFPLTSCASFSPANKIDPAVFQLVMTRTARRDLIFVGRG
jgi:hypothetical protein